MKFILLTLALVGSQAMAYHTGTYNCKNGDQTLPQNIYKISDAVIGSGVTVPFLEITRYFRKDIEDPNSAVVTVNLKGLASISAEDGVEILRIADFKLEFDNGELFGCKQ